MTQTIKFHKRLSPNESVSLVKDLKRNVSVWRHRQTLLNNTHPVQIFEDYPYDKFKTITNFKTYIETLKIL